MGSRPERRCVGFTNLADALSLVSSRLRPSYGLSSRGCTTWRDVRRCRRHAPRTRTGRGPAAAHRGTQSMWPRLQLITPVGVCVRARPWRHAALEGCSRDRPQPWRLIRSRSSSRSLSRSISRRTNVRMSRRSGGSSGGGLPLSGDQARSRAVASAKARWTSTRCRRAPPSSGCAGNFPFASALAARRDDPRVRRATTGRTVGGWPARSAGRRLEPVPAGRAPASQPPLDRPVQMGSAVEDHLRWRRVAAESCRCRWVY